MLNGEYSDLRIGPGTRITLTFSVSLQDGEVVDQIEEPASFAFGDGSLLPAFEKSMLGMKAGAKRTVELEESEGFGEWRKENEHVMKKSAFSQELSLEPGLVVSFTTPEGELPGVVKAVGEQTVTVDFNHPLAGKALTFSYHILRVEEAAEQGVELRGG